MRRLWFLVLALTVLFGTVGLGAHEAQACCCGIEVPVDPCDCGCPPSRPAPRPGCSVPTGLLGVAVAPARQKAGGRRVCEAHPWPQGQAVPGITEPHALPTVEDRAPPRDLSTRLAQLHRLRI